MIDWTYTHFRVLMRLLAPKALLYTEMQTVGAIKNNPQRALLYSPMESPLALQLGGAEKEGLILCAKLAEDQGFAEVNLNLGCPSDKVQAGRFGACLMKEPKHVAECLAAMKHAVSIPVTAKMRIGIDDQDSYEFFAAFAHQLVEAGCDKLIVHARKAWLHGLNPKQNRTIPPVHYDFVWRIKEELGTLPVVINGNLLTLDDVMTQMQYVDGVMIGRLACNNPYALVSLHHWFYPQSNMTSRARIVTTYLDYLVEQFANGVPLSILFKPIMNFAHGLSGAKHWKEALMFAQKTRNLEPVMSAIPLLNAERSDFRNTTPSGIPS
jgi:tRNA-dihydrouridine synthase A